MPPPNTSSAPATRGDEDPASPTVMLQAYLRSQGKPLTAQNMQAALMANARNPGVIPGLENDLPSSDPGVGQSGNVAGQIEKAPTSGRNLPVPPIPPTGGGENPPIAARTAADDAGDTRTSGGVPFAAAAAPLGALILGGGGLWAANRGRGSAPPTPGSSVPPPVDPGAGANDVVDYTMLDPASAQTGDRFDTEPTPMEMAMQRAMQPQVTPTVGGPQTMIGDTSYTGVRPGMAPPQGVQGMDFRNNAVASNVGAPQLPLPPGRDIAIPQVPPNAITVPTGARPPPDRFGPAPRMVIKGLHLY